MALFKALVVIICLCVVGFASPFSNILDQITPSFPDLQDADLQDLIQGLQRREWTSVQLTKAYIARIQATNSDFHAVNEINPDALAIAASLDAERAEGRCRGPLHGVPMLIKDNIATKDRLNNSAGSYALLGATVGRDSTVVAKLRAAGVVVLGKSSLSEWAFFRSNFRPGNGSSCNGWSAYRGQVTGAYFPGMDPSGSSSGSGVGTSIGLAWAALGTETAGSIVGPSSRSNVVGIKPTVGLTSRSLVIPISEHQDTVGPIARTVKDAAYVLAAIAGSDRYDNYTSAIPFANIPNYVKACKLSSLKGKRIGIPRNVLDRSPPIDSAIMDAFEAAIKVIESAGATIVDNANYTLWDELELDSRDPFGKIVQILAADFIINLPDYLSHLHLNPNNIHNLADLKAFTQKFPQEEYPRRDTAYWDLAQSLGFNNTSPQFWHMYQDLLQYAGPGGLTGALTTYRLDAMVLPTDFAVLVPAIGGLPMVNVPMGAYPKDTPVRLTERWNLVKTAPNVPFGISFMGAKWSEESLIGYAYAYEQRSQFRKKITPYTSPTIGIADV